MHSTVDRSIRLLKLLAEQPMNVQQIAEKLEIHKSSASRLVKTLESHHFVSYNGSLVEPGFGILNLAYQIQDNLDIRKIAHDHMESVRNRTEGTVHLAVLDNDEIVYIDKKDSRLPVRMHSRIGNRSPVHCTGVGKAILAFLEKTECERVLDKISYKAFTKNTITKKEQLLQELADIRKKGYAIDNEEHESEIFCLAAPIFNFEKEVVASLSVSFTSPNSSIEDLLKYKKLLLETTANISKQLGY